MQKKIALLFLGIVLGGWSCGGGGCGENQADTKTSANVKASDGRTAPSGGGVGGVAEGATAKPNADGSRFDTAGAQGASNDAASQAQEAAGKKPGKLGGPQTIFDVDPPGFSRVLGAKLPSLVIVVGAGCADCDAAMPALRTLSRELRGRFEFFRIDSGAAGASGVLPSGILAPPAFILYDAGKPASSRSGLPFARETAQKDRPEEPLADYQRRLYRWFRDALAEKNLKFGSI